MSSNALLLALLITIETKGIKGKRRLRLRVVFAKVIVKSISFLKKAKEYDTFLAYIVQH
jgi:hypothetical protein